MIILVLNCGSSSIKYQLMDYNPAKPNVLAKGTVERVGLSDAILTHRPTGKDKLVVVKDISDHTVGINMILKAIINPEHGVISGFDQIEAIGHRVAHGGEYFSKSVIIDNEVKEKIENLFEIAPLHNPAHLKGVAATEKLLPSIPQVAVFDTSYHQTIPKENFMYALPYKYYKQYKVRKYGFHGTSHKFVATKSAKMVGIDLTNSKIITCHLGNGASITAIKNGESFDTSMGFTPVDGLVMGTRCGDVDPGALFYIAQKEEMSFKNCNDMINKESGVAGVSGISSDMRDIHSAIDNGSVRAALSLKMMVNRIKKYIGGFAAGMDGVDMIVFTGGIGENDEFVRAGVCDGLTNLLGIKYDKELNKVKGIDRVLSTDDSKVKIVLACTDEELVIAQDTYQLTCI